MTHEPSHGDRAPAPGRPDWADVTRRVRDVTEHGQRFRGPSMQAAGVAVAVSASALAIWVASTDEGGSVVLTIGLGVTSVVVVLVGWLRARSSRALSPFFVWRTTGTPTAALGPAERRSLNRQIMGRDPIEPERADLVRALITLKRRANRAALLPVAGLFLMIATLGTAAGTPLLAVGAPMFLVVFLAAVTLYETRRDDRVLAAADEAATSTA
ncbi:hypothetical protein ABID81_000073 [Frigoribacterium sp. PvP054]|uniref:hypothetical protein n=1 Tax=Frigoribacterium sp. PvP054 TaxID=3156438 RepID=UPI0033917072